jgi:uncharacterized protein YkwD
MINKLACLLLLAGCLLLTIACNQQREEHSADVVQLTGSRRTSTESNPDLARAATVIISRTNSFRQDQGRQPVEIHPILTATAQDFATYMARTDRYGHSADGNQPAERAKQHGYAYCLVSENIAYQYSSAGFTPAELVSGFVEGWQQSPGHRQNMLAPEVTETGVAVAQSDESGYYYAVQMFGRPQSLMVEFGITNMSDATVRYRIEDETFPLPPRYTRTHQRCQTTAVTFQWPTGQPGPTIQPGNGVQYTVVQEESGTFKVEKE